ncbi:MAG TPA: Imm8 family immunity protein [Pyrinomonadaceae bacterium]|jgi:hypothetical protein
MNLEIVAIYSQNLKEDEMPEDLENFSFPIVVELSEKNGFGAEMFHFFVASPAGLQGEVENVGFKHLRGLILMNKFDWKVVRRAIENLINHSRRLKNWKEVVEFWSRYSRYDSEDL